MKESLVQRDCRLKANYIVFSLNVSLERTCGPDFLLSQLFQKCSVWLSAKFLLFRH